MRDRRLLLTALLAVACGGDPYPPSESMPVRAYPESGLPVHPDSALRAELLAMGEEDQAVRAGLTPEAFQDTAFMMRMMRTDSALSSRLREIVAAGGWPDADRVGRDAVHAAFLVVQHSPFHDFLEQVLPRVERDVRAGVLAAQDYAILYDRVQRQKGLPQRYGTQYSVVDGVFVRDPVEDPANLDRRRADLGLVPIAEYERVLAEAYGAEVRSQ